MTSYYLYHDECKEAGFWHAYLLVPQSFRELLASTLRKARQEHRLQAKRLSFKSLSKDAHYSCARSYFTIVAAALQQQKPNNMFPFYSGRGGTRNGSHSHYSTFDDPPGCKATVLYFPQGLQAFTHCEGDVVKQIEVSFRIGAKSLINYLLNSSSSSELIMCYLDGEKHYRGRLRKKQTLRVLEDSSKGHIRIQPDCEIHGEGLEGDDRIILDALDIFLGAIRYRAGIIPEKVSDGGKMRRLNIAKDSEKHVEYLSRHAAGKRNSRFYRGLSLSEARIDNNEFNFSELTARIQAPVCEQMEIDIA